MNGYEVTIEDLRRTAGKYDALLEDLGSSKMPDSATGSGRVGHIEVASWLKELVSRTKDAQRELGKGLESLSEYLRDKARDYEQADLDSAHRMQSDPFAEGGSSKLTPLSDVPRLSSQQQPLPHVYGQDGAQFSPLTPPPSGASTAE
ncbi:hypothetical protein ACFWQC_17150 [Nocardioides sp. NPDC058538]|uniref:hypothetical protein n=1 Tax=Nocardioides sp. NPDC058538 TaxID=3346542 RepID=UPI00364E2988